MAAVVRAALAHVAGADAARAELAALVERASMRMRQMDMKPSGSQILPVIVGTDTSAVALAGAMQARGYDIRAIRPPTVPEGTARLRISITRHATAEMIDTLFADLAPLLAEARAA